MKRILRKYHVFLSYVFFGILAAAVNIAAYTLLSLILNVNDPVQLEIATIAAWLFGTTFSYYVNRRYVFKSKNSRGKESFRFFEMRVVTLFLDMALMALLVAVMGMNDILSKVLVQLFTSLLNYIVSRLLIFR